MASGQLENAQMGNLYRGMNAASIAARTGQMLRSANDWVNYGGMKILRSQLPAMIQAVSMDRYRKGLIGNDKLTAELTNAANAAKKLEAEAARVKNTKQAEFYAQQAREIQLKLDAIETLKNPQARIDALNKHYPESGNQVLNANQAIARLKENFFQQGELNAMKAIRGHAQEKYQKAKTIMVELHKKGLPWTEAADKATKAVENAEATYWKEYNKLTTEAERKELKKNFYAIMRYVPKKNVNALGE